MSDARVYVLLNGRDAGGARAQISLFDRGFLFGHGVFETLRVYRGAPFELALHVQRLLASAEAAKVPLAVSREELAGEVLRAVAEFGAQDAYVRVILSSGVGTLELLPQLPSAPTRVVLVAELPRLTQTIYTNGLKVRAVPVLRTADSTGVIGAKLTNYLPNLLALDEARRHGDDDALFVAADGNITQGAASNIFAVCGGRLVTPSLAGPTLAGITRRHVMALAEARGIEVVEQSLSLDEVRAAKELFLTSSIRELAPCVQVDGVQVGTGMPGPVTKSLHRAFRDLVGCPLEADE